MKLHLIKEQTIWDYVGKQASSESSFNRWLLILRNTDWEKPEDIIRTFPSADILGSDSNRVVFNIGGNNYRVICKYMFGALKVHLFIKWIGTHAEYTKLCNSNQQYIVDDF